jgi:hypothetical protein
MLYFSITTGAIHPSAAVVYMDVSSQRGTDKIAHHWCSLVVRRILATAQLETCAIRAIDGPTGLRHRSMASLVLPLLMT